MKKNLKISILLCLSIWLGCFSLQAQDPDKEAPIATDRPGAGTSPGLVGKGFLQLEVGAEYGDYDHEAMDSHIWTFSTLLVRYGMLDNLELRLGWDFRQIETEINGVIVNNLQSGYTPLLAGLKVGVSKEKGLLPEIGVVGHLFLPFSAGSDYKTRNTGGEILLAFSNSLNGKSSLDYVLGVGWGGDSAELNYSYALSYGRSFSKKLGGYLEVYGVFPEHSSGQNLWNIGFTYLINGDLQIDASFGTGFDTDQRSLVGIGISYRLR